MEVFPVPCSLPRSRVKCLLSTRYNNMQLLDVHVHRVSWGRGNTSILQMRKQAQDLSMVMR